MKPKAQEYRLNKPEVVYYHLLSAACRDLQVDQNTTNLVLGLARARDWKALIRFAKNVSSQMYGDSSEHFRWAQLSSLIVKVPFPGVGKNVLRDAAWTKFLQAEHSCKRTNQRFLALERATTLGAKRFPAAMYQRLLRARELILRVLGEKPDLSQVYELARFGPGSTVDLGGDATHLLRKVDALTVVPSAAPYAVGLLWSHAQLREQFCDTRGGVHCLDPEKFRVEVLRRLNYCDYNKIAFVPKNAETDRTIGAEGAVTGLIQLGFGNLIAQLLKTVARIDLTDQTRNQALARAGSQGGHDPIVTIDLKGASDSLARLVVKFFLPGRWHDALAACRSPEYLCKVKGVRARYEKFTSMGNGFCFPLETLIFWALAVTCSDECGVKTVGVYGDDIAVRQSSALLLIETLKFCGFRTNVDKTFIHGPFRESCGADFFHGKNVRPFVLDYMPDNIQALIKIGNGVMLTHESTLPSVRDVCIRELPDEYKLLRPIHGPADTAITVPLDLFMASIQTERRWCGDRHTWEWQELRSSPVLDRERPPTEPEELLAVLGGATAATLGVGRNGQPRARPARSKDKDVVPLFAVRRRTTLSRVWTVGVGNPVIPDLVWRLLHFRYLRSAS